jgi:hypothetical protein
MNPPLLIIYELLPVLASTLIGLILGCVIVLIGHCVRPDEPEIHHKTIGSDDEPDAP